MPWCNVPSIWAMWAYIFCWGCIRWTSSSHRCTDYGYTVVERRVLVCVGKPPVELSAGGTRLCAENKKWWANFWNIVFSRSWSPNQNWVKTEPVRDGNRQKVFDVTLVIMQRYYFQFQSMIWWWEWRGNGTKVGSKCFHKNVFIDKWNPNFLIDKKACIANFNQIKFRVLVRSVLQTCLRAKSRAKVLMNRWPQSFLISIQSMS